MFVMFMFQKEQWPTVGPVRFLLLVEWDVSDFVSFN